MNYKLNYKFKPGDKVTVRKDLATYETYQMLSGETPGLDLMATPLHGRASWETGCDRKL